MPCIDLFGVPLDEDKDETGSVAWDPQGILNRGISCLHEEFGDDLIVMADTCLDEFTSHGHCGVLDDKGRVLNDESVKLYQDMARSQARAGAQIVSPSGMMDGQVAAIRADLDEAGHEDVAIMAYSAKYASAFFGPFRDAVGSSLEGDRRTISRTRATSANPARSRARHRRGRGLRHGQARSALLGRALGRGGDFSRAGRGLPGLR